MLVLYDLRPVDVAGYQLQEVVGSDELRAWVKEGPDLGLIVDGPPAIRIQSRFARTPRTPNFLRRRWSRKCCIAVRRRLRC